MAAAELLVTGGVLWQVRAASGTWERLGDYGRLWEALANNLGNNSGSGKLEAWILQKLEEDRGKPQGKQRGACPCKICEALGSSVSLGS